MITVYDAKGNQIDFDAAVQLMDDDIREDMASNFVAGFDNPQAFLIEYARRHFLAFGEEFSAY